MYPIPSLVHFALLNGPQREKRIPMHTIQKLRVESIWSLSLSVCPSALLLLLGLPLCTSSDWKVYRLIHHQSWHCVKWASVQSKSKLLLCFLACVASVRWMILDPYLLHLHVKADSITSLFWPRRPDKRSYDPLFLVNYEHIGYKSSYRVVRQ